MGEAGAIVNVAPQPFRPPVNGLAAAERLRAKENAGRFDEKNGVGS